MNTTKINRAVKSARQIGWQMSETFCDYLQKMNNPLYRVILAGEFQVGKSLMADKAFLQGKGLLRSGIGLPTTSVVTEVSYGETYALSVYYRGNNEPIVISEPSAADVVNYTTAKTEKERTELSEKIEKVVISVPDANLKKYAILDTPGIDDANESVMLNSTFPQIMSADAVILVIPPRSLDSIERKFLQGSLFDKSISRLMIMISYDPRHPMGKQVREELVENIQAELQMMGRGYIPVKICCYDDSVDEELNTPEKVRQAVDSFAEENVKQGRVLRVAGALLNELSSFENELRSRLELNGVGQGKIRELELKLEEAEQKLTSRRLAARAKVASKESEISIALKDRLQIAMESLKRSLMSRFEKCKKLGDVQDELVVVKNELEHSIKKLFEQESSTAKKQLEEVLSIVDAELRNAADELIRTLDFGYSINTGHLGKLNSKFLTAVDYLLAAVLSPYALLLDVLFRYVLGKLPLIRNLLPAVFVRNQVVKTIDESLQDISEKVVSDISSQFKQSFKRIENDINLHFKHLYQTTIMPILKAIEEARNTQLSEGEIDSLKSKLSTVCGIIAELRTACV
ncbi:MAG: dynamin family protein [Akkermansia sp.]|nr:dynamin family protein [Akkermansia sp.]